MLRGIVAMAAPLAGCCETTSMELDLRANGASAQPWLEAGDASTGLGDSGFFPPGEIDCQRACLGPIVGRCMNWRVVGCARVDSAGTTIHCSYENTDCPDVVPRGDCGRRTDGVDPVPFRGDDRVGRRLAAMATLEAASIPAFTRLERELAAHGAPRALRRSALRARTDEVRHARTMRALASRRGAAMERVRRRSLPVRALDAVALENAVEGCVRETWGALVAEHQSTQARDADVREAMRGIARDEARHAALAWRVHAWALTQMDEHSRARCERAMRDAVQSLRAELTSGANDPSSRAIGWPEGHVARAMLDALDAQLWSRA